MLKYNKNEPLFSVHIPKTGGSSFKEVLVRWFGDKLFFHYFSERGNEMPSLHPMQPGICIHGHFNRKRGFGIKGYYPDAKQIIAFLRDPLEIVISRYFYVKEMEKTGQSYREGKRFSLHDDISEYITAAINDENYHPNILDYFPEAINSGNYRKLINKYFIYIGVTEDYQFCVNALADKLGFAGIRASRKNQAERYGSISPELRQKFIAARAIEYEAYNYVLENYRVW